MSTDMIPADGTHPSGDRAPVPFRARRYPPIAVLDLVSLGCIIVGGVLMASYVPRKPPLGVPTALAAFGGVLLVAAAVLVARLQDFNWTRFFTVFWWGLLAYVISAGMIGFAFVHDHTRGASLALVIGMLVIFALDVPLIIAFTAARYSSAPFDS
jgi:hypothetical protein